VKPFRYPLQPTARVLDRLQHKSGHFVFDAMAQKRHLCVLCDRRDMPSGTQMFHFGRANVCEDCVGTAAAIEEAFDA